MLKKLTTVLLTGALLLTPLQTVNATGNYFVTLNGARQNVTPIVQNGTTLLPVATVGKLVGYQATWNNQTKSGVLSNQSVDISFRLGSNALTVMVNGAGYKIFMPEPVKVINGKTYLPLRAVGECLGMTVGYNAETREISLKTDVELKNTGKESTVDTKNLNAEIIRLEKEIRATFGSEAVEDIQSIINQVGFPITQEEYKNYLETILRNKDSILKEIERQKEKEKQKEIEKQKEQLLNAQSQQFKSEPQQKSQRPTVLESEQNNSNFAKPSKERVTLLPDHKIKNMNFTQAEINYILRDTLTDEEQELYDEINQLRQSNGLAPLPLNMELTKVARVHVLDSKKNNPQTLTDARGQKGNLHSWSISKYWTGGAYTPDHRYAQMMWDKPRELSNYSGNGYEISTARYGADHSPKSAVDAWNSSPPHRAVIVSSGQWDILSSFGVAIDGPYAHAWFGEE